MNGNGVPVEWALRMARFNQDCLMSHVAEAKGISRDCAVALAVMVTGYHDAAPQMEPPASVFDAVG